ncbi:MAG: Ig-like domain-containing protein [Candidatus Cloacimonetes bacterium]|nr:Ig-like domain-containing protein [Candidatus Cloacimonadota bacterium]
MKMKKFIMCVMVFLLGILGCSNPTENIPVESISLNKIGAFLEIGEQIVLKATIEPENATNQQIIWSSEIVGYPGDNIASVSQEGIVTAITEGITSIYIRIKGSELTASCIIYSGVGRVPGELIIIFYEHINEDDIEIFIQKYYEYRLKHEEILSEIVNIHLFTFDYELIDEHLFLKMIQNDPMVEFAGFNHTWTVDPWITEEKSHQEAMKKTASQNIAMSKTLLNILDTKNVFNMLIKNVTQRIITKGDKI